MKNSSEIIKGKLVTYQGEIAKIIEPRQNTIIIEQFGKRVVTTINQLKDYEIDVTDDKQFRETLLYKLEKLENLENLKMNSKKIIILLIIPYILILIGLLVSIIWLTA